MPYFYINRFIMKKLVFLILLLTNAFFANAQNDGSQNKPASALRPEGENVSEYLIDYTKSKIIWTGISIKGNHSGELKIKEGYFFTKNNLLNNGYVKVDMTTINCTTIPDGVINFQVVGTLKASDFFDVKKYPFSEIEIVSLVHARDNIYGAEGFMTIKGTRAPISFDAEVKLYDDIMEARAKQVRVNRSRYHVGISALNQAEYAEQINNYIDNFFDLDVRIVAYKKEKDK